MKFTFRQIAHLIGGEVEGDDSLEIDQFYKTAVALPAQAMYLPHAKVLSPKRKPSRQNRR